MSSPPDITVVLHDLERGDGTARERLWPLVYPDLHELACRAMAGERPDHTLQATALLHEVYLRLVDQDKVGFNGRMHFFATAAAVIRNILVDHARDHRAAKRGGDRERVTLCMIDGPEGESATLLGSASPGDRAGVPDILDLDAALKELAALDERQARVIELRFFGGLDVPAAAVVLGVSERTVKGDWRVARAWLAQRLGQLRTSPS